MGEHFEASRVALATTNEAARRVNGIAPVDGRGRVWWFDDFENGLNKWGGAVIGTGAGIAVSNDSFLGGGLSCRLTTGDAAFDSATIYKWLAIPNFSNFGLEVPIYVPDPAHVNNVTITITLMWQGVAYEGQIILEPVSHRIRINDGGVVPTLDNNVVLLADFISLKVVINPITKMYHRVILSSKEYFTKTIPLVVYAPGHNGRYLYLSVSAQNNLGGSVRKIYLDNTIVTFDEP